MSSSHSIKVNGLKRILDLLRIKEGGTEYFFRLYFVVPDYVYASFVEKQEYVKVGGKKHQ